MPKYVQKVEVKKYLIYSYLVSGQLNNCELFTGDQVYYQGCADYININTS